MRIRLEEKTIGIIGMKRSGKTYLTRELVEAIKDECIIIDTIGKIKPKTAQKYTAEPKNLDKQAVAFGLLIKGIKKKSISINLSLLTRSEKLSFMNIALKTAGIIKKKKWFFDEMAEFLPQERAQCEEVERLIRHGGNEGNTFIFNTQRPAYLNKNTFDLVDILIVFKTVWKNDLIVLREVLSDLGRSREEIEAMVEKITTLGVGEYAIFFFTKE